jgi:hypothetical protein
MSKIEKLSIEQEKQINGIKNKWLEKVFKYELYQNASFENTMKQMKDLYSFCNLNEPLVLFLDSPMACQIAANIICKEENQVESQVFSQVKNQVWDQVSNQVWNQVSNQVGNQVWNQVGIR